MLVRPATAHDAYAIALIQIATWRAAYRGLMPNAMLDALDVKEGAEFWRALLSTEHQTVVAETDSDVIGFCSLIPARDGEGDNAEIAALYVSPAHWRQGTGGALCAAVFSAALAGRFSGISLWVLAANERAIAFYEAQGFLRDGAARTEALPDGTLIPEVRLRRGPP